MSAAEAIAPEQSVDEVRQSLSVTDKGKTANTIDNCRIVFCCDPLLRDAIRLNLLTDRVDIVQDLGWRRNTSALTDTDVKYLLCALPGFVDSKNEEKTERNAGYLVVSHSGGGMLRQGTRKGIRRTPANRGMRAHWVVKGLDISEDVCHGMCP